MSKPIEKLYKELKKQTGKNDAYFGSLFGLKNPRALQTSSAKDRYKEGIVNLIEEFSLNKFWIRCGECDYYNTHSEMDNNEKQEVPSCQSCGKEFF